MDLSNLIDFGSGSWTPYLIRAAGVTVAVAAAGFVIGGFIGTLVAWAKLTGNLAARGFADLYTTVMRGIPDLLIIYLFYFGGSLALTRIGAMFGADGFIGVPAFASGALAIGVVSGAYQGEVYRGAFQAIQSGEIEAARSVGMHRMLVFRRIIVPQIARFAIPGMGNVWQLVLKESALISVTGLVELLRQTQIAADSTRRPFDFYLAAIGIYLVITWISSLLFQAAEKHARRGMGRHHD